jgi:type II secretion system protein I
VKKSHGFTLLEMIVATTIMAIAVVGLLAGISTAVRNAARLQDHDRAAQRARVRMNDLLLERTLPLNALMSGDFDPTQAGGLQSGWRARLIPFEMPPHPAAGETAIDRLELEVWWKNGSQERSFLIDAYRPRLLTPADIAPVAP